MLQIVCVTSSYLLTLTIKKLYSAIPLLASIFSLLMLIKQKQQPQKKPKKKKQYVMLARTQKVQSPLS